ncbi:MAG: glycosyltransferase family 4 protein [Anaerolineales bacterium]|nr:glycosyltransferase family 4 protein [Anaerolineales bacterium]
MHILLIHQAFAALDEPGGTRHHELALHLAAQGHRVTVIASPVSYLTGKTTLSPPSPPSPLAPLGEGGVTILRAYTYAALHKSFVHRIFAFFSFMFSSFLLGLKVKNVDLVWGTSPPIFQGVTAWALARVKWVPFLFEVRDLWPAFAVAVGVLTNPLLIRMSEWLERFLYGHAGRVMINSPGFLEHVKARGAKRVELVPNGADTSMFDPHARGEAFRTKQGLNGKFIALYAGAHGMSNDLDVLLDAAAQLTDCPDAVIVLLGDGKEKPRLMVRAKEMGLQNIVFIPSIPKTEMGEALAASDACIGILKSIEMYKTVYPNKIFDYLAAGRPVVLAMEGVIREVVQAADAGVLIPPGDAATRAKAIADAIRLLSNDRERCQSMGLSGRAYLEAHFDRGKLAEQLRGVVEGMGREGK